MPVSETLIALVPWTPRPEWLDSLRNISPGIETHCYKVGGSKEPPEEIPSEVWKRATVLFTWRAYPDVDIAPNLRYVQTISAGCNDILDLPLFRDTDIPFCNASGIHPPQITEWVFATFLAFQHHLPEHLDNQKISNWVNPENDEDTEDVVGLRVGILGYGAIGRQCARVARAFGMDVYAYTLHERATPESRIDDTFTEPDLGDPNGQLSSKWFYGEEQLHTFLGADLDLLIVTLPLTPKTRGLISKEELNVLSKRKAYVSNVGRGPLINTEDLIEALNTGKIRGAALDVTDPEPLPADHPLWKAKNVIVTPHCSGNSNHYNERVWRILSSNMRKRQNDEKLINVINKALGY